MIDWDRVAAMRDEIGAGEFHEVIEMFLAESDEVIERLRAKKPYPTLEAELHFLKGSALNLGFQQLADLCGRGEKAAEAGQAVDVGYLIRVYAATRESFAAGLGRMTAA